MESPAVADLEGCMNCCGLDELANIQCDPSAKSTIDGLLGNWRRVIYDYPTQKYKETGEYQPCAAHLIFSDAHDSKKRENYGDELMKYIRKHKLGTVIKTRKDQKNPNSGNMISCYVWTVDPKGCKKYCDKKGLKNDYD